MENFARRFESGAQRMPQPEERPRQGFLASEREKAERKNEGLKKRMDYLRELLEVRAESAQMLRAQVEAEDEIENIIVELLTELSGERQMTDNEAFKYLKMELGGGVNVPRPGKRTERMLEPEPASRGFLASERDAAFRRREELKREMSDLQKMLNKEPRNEKEAQRQDEIADRLRILAAKRQEADDEALRYEKMVLGGGVDVPRVKKGYVPTIGAEYGVEDIAPANEPMGGVIPRPRPGYTEGIPRIADKDVMREEDMPVRLPRPKSRKRN